MMVAPPLGPITLPNWDQGPTVDLMTWRAWGGGVGWVAGQGRVHSVQPSYCAPKVRFAVHQLMTACNARIPLTCACLASYMSQPWLLPAASRSHLVVRGLLGVGGPALAARAARLLNRGHLHSANSAGEAEVV